MANQRRKREKARAPDPPQPTEQAPPAQGDGMNFTVPSTFLLDLTERLTRIEEGQKGTHTRIDETNARIDRLADTQQSQEQAIQHIAQVQEQLAVENAETRGDLNAHLSALSATVASAGDRIERVEKQVDTLAQAQGGGLSGGRSEKDGWKGMADFLSTVKTWAPWLFAGGAFVVGIVYRVLQMRKGGQP